MPQGDVVIQQFCKQWVAWVEAGAELSNEHKQEPLCKAFWRWMYCNSVPKVLARGYLNAMHDEFEILYGSWYAPFGEYRNLTYPTYTQNPKRLAYAKARAQGRLITDDFGNSVPTGGVR